MNEKSYQDIAAQLRANVPAMKSVDIFNNQYEEPERHAALNCPCVLVEWLPTNWQAATQGIQQGTGGFRIHCVVKTLRGTANIDTQSSPQATLNLQHLVFQKQVHAALQGFAPDSYSALSRTQTLPDHRYTSIIAIVHEYMADEVDESADEYRDYINQNVTDFIVPGEIIKAGTQS